MSEPASQQMLGARPAVRKLRVFRTHFGTQALHPESD